MNVVHLNTKLHYLDIRVEFRNVQKNFLRIFLYTLDKNLASISRDPDEMIFGLIYSVSTLS